MEAYERYWTSGSPSVKRWNSDKSKWLSRERFGAKTTYRHNVTSLMALQADGEIWEYCSDPCSGDATVMSKYRPLE